MLGRPAYRNIAIIEEPRHPVGSDGRQDGVGRFALVRVPARGDSGDGEATERSENALKRGVRGNR